MCRLPSTAVDGVQEAPDAVAVDPVLDLLAERRDLRVRDHESRVALTPFFFGGTKSTSSPSARKHDARRRTAKKEHGVISDIWRLAHVGPFSQRNTFLIIFRDNDWSDFSSLSSLDSSLSV